MQTQAYAVGPLQTAATKPFLSCSPMVYAFIPHVLAEHSAISCQPSNSYAHVVVYLEHFSLV